MATSSTSAQEPVNASGSFTVTLSFDEALKGVGSVLWKYAQGVEGPDNYKTVYNIKEDTGDAVDYRVLSDSWDERTAAVIDMLRDFVSTVTESQGVSKSVTLTMPARWNGRQEALRRHMARYVTCWMLYDWYNATAPGEAAVYGNQAQEAAKDIISNIYDKKAPI